jgi:hypothetical protein
MKRFIVASVPCVVGLILFCWGLIGQSQLTELVTDYPVNLRNGNFVVSKFVPRKSGYYELYLVVPTLNDAQKEQEILEHHLSIAVRIELGDKEIYRAVWPENEDNPNGVSDRDFAVGIGEFDAIQDKSYKVELSVEGANEFVSQRELKLELCYTPGYIKDLEIDYTLLRLSGEVLGALGFVIAIIQFIRGVIRRPLPPASP